MPLLTYRITILGCRVNHAEARDLESILRKKGLHQASTGRVADLEVIHTCSVTNSAAAKSRHAIRRAIRRNQPHLSALGSPSVADLPDLDHEPTPLAPPSRPQVIVTGCFTSTNPREAAELSGPGRSIPHDADDGSLLIDRFEKCLDDWLSGPAQSRSHIRDPKKPSSNNSPLPLPVTYPARDAGSHTRAELRIQDGCDAHCTFCIIPRIRKTLRSKRIPDAVEEAHRLVQLGHLEIVLTGIFIGAFGHETAIRRKQKDAARHHLADLIDAVAQVPGLLRLRISSMEPGDVTEPLLDAMLANAPVVVPHLHLPLQSGSDAILNRMNRQYRVGQYLDMIAQVNDALTTPEGLPPAITTDIIAGFPGETESDFQRTVDIALRVRFLHMHVFPYSPRKGTAAARWTELQLPPQVLKSRVRQLIDLEEDPIDGLSIRFRRRLLGRTLRVILEQPDKASPGHLTGRCDQYALISIPTDRPRGSLVHVNITDVSPDRTHGELAPANLPLTLLR